MNDFDALVAPPRPPVVFRTLTLEYDHPRTKVLREWFDVVREHGFDRFMLTGGALLRWRLGLIVEETRDLDILTTEVGLGGDGECTSGGKRYGRVDTVHVAEHTLAAYAEVLARFDLDALQYAVCEENGQIHMLFRAGGGHGWAFTRPTTTARWAKYDELARELGVHLNTPTVWLPDDVDKRTRLALDLEVTVRVD